jgi:hypothetical protein
MTVRIDDADAQAVFSIRGKSATGGLILCPGLSPSP